MATGTEQIKPDCFDRPAPDVVVRFLGTIFDSTDYVLVRPTETWTEGNRKKSAVIYGAQRWQRAGFLNKEGPWQSLLKSLEAHRANAFFGVCPRLGTKGQFDLSWQIRTVRVLWADLDHCTVEEALKRCATAGLPRPSVIVRSGNGVHLYWILSEPYRIDDVDRPPAVLTSFLDQGEGKKKKAVKYIKPKKDELGVTLYLDDGKTLNPECPWGELSAKARHVQDVLAGLATKVGGDHTTDLARCLRLPGTMNRKDERNGKPPVPCELMECDPSRSYPFADFEKLAVESPARQRREKVAAILLPAPRRLNAGTNRQAILYQKVNACAAVEPGQRSERDWNLICWCIENAVDREEVWSLVDGKGKFAEGGRGYFDRTWAKAAAYTQEKIYNRNYAGGNGKVASNGIVFSMNGEGGGGDDSHAEDTDTLPTDSGPCEADDDPHRLARSYLDRLRARGEQRLLFWREDWLRWDRCVYRPIPDKDLRAEVTHHVRREFERLNRMALIEWQQQRGNENDEGGPPEIQRVTTALINDVIQALQSQTILPAATEPPHWLVGESSVPAVEVLACQNTLVHIPALVNGSDNALLPRTPIFFSLNALNYDFSLEAGEPRHWLKFLGDVFPNDQDAIDSLQEWFGYCLLPNTNQQKILLVVGPKRSGKGTIARVLTALVGVGNVCTPTLASLGTHFGLWPLIGKTLAIISDARISGRTDAAVVIERLLSISGEDAQTIDRKHKQPLTVQLPVRLVLMTNELPRLHDDSGALPGRCILLRMRRSWYGQEDVGLGRRLLQELPGILLWAIAGWQRLHKRGYFRQPESSKQVIREFEELSSDIKTFLEDCCVLDADARMPRSTLYQRWQSWCETNGVKATPIGVFGRDLRAALPDLETCHTKLPDGKRQREYLGITLNTVKFSNAEEEYSVT